MDKKAKARKLKYITRVENTKYRDHWWVRIHKAGKQYQIRIFDDDHFGTESEILKFVIYCRDKLHEMLFPGFTVSDRKPTYATNNDTGLSGIRYIKRGPNNLEYYIVSWTPKKGSVNQKLFPIHHLGEDVALEQAKNYRQEMISKYYIKSSNKKTKTASKAA